MKTPLVMSLMLSLLILSLWIQPVLGQVLAPAPVLSFQNTWGGNDLDSAEGVAVAPDGSIYVVGRTRSFSANNVDFDVFLVKYAPNGTLLFQQTYGTAGGSEDGNAVAVGPDGSVYVAGTSADTKALLVKFAPNGTLIWQRTWGGTPGGEFANGVAVSGDGASVYITGGTGSFGAGFDDALLVKFDANGALVWQKT
jgi:sugar lactone lactonase YvrE